MRNEYVTKRYVKENLQRLLLMCGDENLKEFIKERMEQASAAKTTECRKYLYFDTIEILQNPYKWKDKMGMGKGINIGEPRVFI